MDSAVGGGLSEGMARGEAKKYKEKRECPSVYRVRDFVFAIAVHQRSPECLGRLGRQRHTRAREAAGRSFAGAMKHRNVRYWMEKVFRCDDNNDKNEGKD
jgi:hypothetical protein